VFRITGVVKDEHAITRYNLSTAPEMTRQRNKDAPRPVFLKVDSTGVYKREFNRNHLVLFDPTQTGGLPNNRTVQIRPNELYVDLTFEKRPTTTNNNNRPEQTTTNNNNRPEQTTTNNNNRPEQTTIKTCSIESILKNKKYLGNNKPYIFLVSRELDEANRTVELAVFKVQLLRYSSNDGMWVFKTEKDRDNASNNATYATELVALSPDLYNKMGTEDGWRFVEHNRLLLHSRRFKCTRSGEHFANDVDDTPLVDYKNKLIDPSYDVQALLQTKRQQPGVRYAFNSYNNGQPLGIPNVKTGVIVKRAPGGLHRFSVQWENKDIEIVELNPTKYGKLTNEIHGWEFVDFNNVFNIQLSLSLKNVM
jgi:hypothetical protein